MALNNNRNNIHGLNNLSAGVAEIERQTRNLSPIPVRGVNLVGGPEL